jgi:hypothetical protein
MEFAPVRREVTHSRAIALPPPLPGAVAAAEGKVLKAPASNNEFHQDVSKTLLQPQEACVTVVPDREPGLKASTVRLFVGNVPHSFTQTELRKWFEKVSVSSCS